MNRFEQQSFREAERRYLDPDDGIKKVFSYQWHSVKKSRKTNKENSK